MSEFIVAKDLGLSVYGQSQVDYSVDGFDNLAYGEAMGRTGLRRATAMENAMKTVEEAIKIRQQKLQELGEALAAVTEAVTSKQGKGVLEKTSLASSAVRILKRYGISAKTTDTVGNYQKLQSQIQLTMDKESTSLKEDANGLQTYLSRRDNAFELASKMIKKANETAAKGIQNIGG